MSLLRKKELCHILKEFNWRNIVDGRKDRGGKDILSQNGNNYILNN
tara:strand:- start:1141 stop:1278 length:138 start_codon:yes stop_codon:yes gene_type:complete